LLVLSAYKYRIYPKKEREMRLKRSLLLLCDLYNWLRVRKIEEYKEHGASLMLTDLRGMALEGRKKSQELQSVYSQVVQNVADRVYTVFKNYFEGRVRFPRSKNPRKYLSLTYPQSGFELRAGRLYLPKIGHVRVFLHRAIQGKIRRLTIKYEVGEWYAVFITEREASEKPDIKSIPDERITGADLGLHNFVVLDNSESAEYPRFLRRSEEKMRELQRRLSGKQKGSKRWRQLSFSLARLHQHVKRQRNEYQNKLLSKLFKGSDVLVLEKLNVQGMMRNHSLAKSMADSSFGKFISKTLFKADVLGKYFVAVDLGAQPSSATIA